MNRETIEKAAKDYAYKTWAGGGFECASEDSFIAGAEWRINSVWHNMNEKPNGMFVILADFGQEEYSLGISLDGIESAKRWAYVSDLLPERKEEKKWH